MATKKRAEAAGEKPKKAKTAAKPVRRAATGGAPRPRIRTHAAGPEAPGGARKRRPPEDRGKALAAAVKAGRGRGAGGPASLRKAPLSGPKRAVKRAPSTEPTPEASKAARELALALASAGLEKKALGIEILDVTGKVDYADFLLVMTGRSDRHVYSIAMGLEEAMRGRKLAPASMEGLTAATWVLIDFGDVVVHVFQEEARALYDIEGLWIDAGRVPVPADGPPPGAPQA